MKIITDTREQRNQHILEKINKAEIPFKIKKLDFGDYSIENYENKVVIERKATLTELAGCFCKGRTRFASEFERAIEAGAKVYLLIEDEKAREKMLLRREMDKDSTLEKEKVFKKTWRSNFTANSMIASIQSWKIKYNFEIIFCSKKESGNKIIEVFQNYIGE